MSREKPNKPRRPRRSADYPTNLWHDVPESCLRMCAQIACITEADNQPLLAQARQATHDLAIRQAGRGRVSGVSWLQYDAADAPAALEKMRAPAAAVTDPVREARDQATLDNARDFLEHHPGGALIVGFCWSDTRVLLAGQS